MARTQPIFALAAVALAALSPIVAAGVNYTNLSRQNSAGVVTHQNADLGPFDDSITLSGTYSSVFSDHHSIVTPFLISLTTSNGGNDFFPSGGLGAYEASSRVEATFTVDQPTPYQFIPTGFGGGGTVTGWLRNSAGTTVFSWTSGPYSAQGTLAPDTYTYLTGSLVSHNGLGMGTTQNQLQTVLLLPEPASMCVVLALRGLGRRPRLRKADGGGRLRTKNGTAA